MPVNYSLGTNYPNPFNPSTVLNYALPSESQVRISILNTPGQEIAIPVDKIESTGYKEATWKAINVPSGLYFYRLEATSTADPSRTFTSVKKMPLVKVVWKRLKVKHYFNISRAENVYRRLSD